MTMVQGPEPTHVSGPHGDPDGPRPPRGRWRALAVAAVVVLVVAGTVTIVATGTGTPDELPVQVDDGGDIPLIGAAPPTTLPGPPTATPGPVAPTQQPTPRPAPPTGSGGAPVPAGGWKLLAQDDFSGSELDPDHWYPYTAQTAGGVGQHLASNLSVSGGVLTVTSRGNTSGGASYGPGQLYGRWEVRARAQRGTGYGPVILLWPDAEDWPEGGEVNIMEIPDPDRQESHFTVHFGEDNSTVTTSTPGDFTQWTTYAVEWTPSYVAGFINGREVFRTTDPETIPPRPMHLAIQQDIGPFGTDWIPARDSTTPAEVKLEIDWVRIYDR
jgi:hypothetical protein